MGIFALNRTEGFSVLKPTVFNFITSAKKQENGSKNTILQLKLTRSKMNKKPITTAQIKPVKTLAVSISRLPIQVIIILLFIYFYY